MLTRYLSAVGYRVIAVDCFGDTDTRRQAAIFRRVVDLSKKHIATIVDKLVAKYNLRDCVYGSGFEQFPESLEFLQSRLLLVGNAARTFNTIQDKRRFFVSLDALGISYPPVSFSAPASCAGWLEKPAHGEGGAMIRPAVVTPRSGEHVYWQRYIEGTPMSLLFAAGDGHIDVFGYHKQWCARQHPQKFLFGGLATSERPAQFSVIEEWAERLAQTFTLKGLNSLDFMIDAEGRSWFLELNPRPSASLQLYEFSAIIAHLDDRAGNRISTTQTQRAGAYQIFYADKDIQINTVAHWPAWIHDRPAPGSIIRRGEPICSMIARSESRSHAAHKLRLFTRIFERKHLPRITKKCTTKRASIR